MTVTPFVAAPLATTRARQLSASTSATITLWPGGRSCDAPIISAMDVPPSSCCYASICRVIIWIYADVRCESALASDSAGLWLIRRGAGFGGALDGVCYPGQPAHRWNFDRMCPTICRLQLRAGSRKPYEGRQVRHAPGLSVTWREPWASWSRSFSRWIPTNPEAAERRRVRGGGRMTRLSSTTRLVVTGQKQRSS